MRIEYIGSKPIKTDNVAWTGVSWNGHGDIQDVPDGAVAKLLAHPTIWQPAAPIAQAEPTTPPKFGMSMIVGDKESVVSLDDMDDKALRAFATQHNLHVDKRKKGDELRALIVTAAVGAV